MAKSSIECHAGDWITFKAVLDYMLHAFAICDLRGEREKKKNTCQSNNNQPNTTNGMWLC